MVKLQPTFIQARLQRGNLFLKMGKLNEAQADYEAVVILLFFTYDSLRYSTLSSNRASNMVFYIKSYNSASIQCFANYLFRNTTYIATFELK